MPLDAEELYRMLENILHIDCSVEIEAVKEAERKIPAQSIIDQHYKNFLQLKERCFKELLFITTVKKYSEGNY